VNPTTRIVFIKKIIEYAVPKKIDKISEQLEIYFNTNLDWAETVIDYSDHIWTSQKNGDGGTVWHNIEEYMQSKLKEKILSKKKK
jgi:hypothetical protein